MGDVCPRGYTGVRRRNGTIYRGSAGIHRVTAGPCRWPGDRPACRWCGGPVQKPRRTFCSEACVDEWAIAFNGGAARSRVEQRDHGVCALCGLDCVLLMRELRDMRRNTKSNDLDADRAWRARYAELGLSPGRHYESHWQADHIVPVSLGGQMLGLANLRTLCTWCHKLETARLARERAAFRARLG